MSDIELNFQKSDADADMEALTIALMNAVGAAVDESRAETTFLTIDGQPVAAIVPVNVDARRGTQVGSGNIQVNRFS